MHKTKVNLGKAKRSQRTEWREADRRAGERMSKAEKIFESKKIEITSESKAEQQFTWMLRFIIIITIIISLNPYH